MHPKKNLMFFSALDGLYMCTPEDPSEVTRIGSENLRKIKCIAWDFKLGTVVLAERTKIKTASGRVLADGFSNILDIEATKKGRIFVADGVYLKALRPSADIWESTVPIMAIQAIPNKLFIARANEILILQIKNNQIEATSIFSSLAPKSDRLYRKKLIRGICWLPSEKCLLCNCGICMLQLFVDTGEIRILRENTTRKILGNKIRRKRDSCFVWSWAIHEFMLL